MSRDVAAGSVQLGAGHPLVLIAGPCVIEAEKPAYDLAARLKQIAGEAGMPLIFKASYDKANRTSLSSYRGPGLQAGLRILARIRDELHLPVTSDVHRFEEIGPAAEVLDIIQIPAFLCRQTDFVVEVARAGRAVNVKKGQFLAPRDMQYILEKIGSTGNQQILLTERGTSFGYHNLVVDMRSLVIMRQLGYPVVYDATHSVQLPGGQGPASGGERGFIAPLARAAAAVGVDALFLEIHETPEQALCDGPNSLRLSELSALVRQVMQISAMEGVRYGA
jgi:2-dehydro-3-deoxyphosphooctonate aldolase (KDO 8-P synthase)